MSDDSATKALIREAYAARHRGDLDTLMGFFHPQCRYRLVGGPAVARPSCSLTVSRPCASRWPG